MPNNTESSSWLGEEAFHYDDYENHVIDESHFVLPTIGDYYKNSIDDIFIEMLSEEIEEKDGEIKDL